MRILQGISAARPSFDANYYSPGTYVAKILRIKSGTSPRNNRDFIAFETEIVGTLDDSNGQAKEVGDCPTYLIQATMPNIFLGEVKRAFMGLGIEESQITEQFVMNSLSDLQPFEGMLVHVEVTLRARKQQTVAFGQQQPVSTPNADEIDLSRFWPVVRFIAPVTGEYAQAELKLDAETVNEFEAYMKEWAVRQMPKIQAALSNATYATPQTAGMAAASAPAQYALPAQYAPPQQQATPAPVAPQPPVNKPKFKLR